MIDLMKDKVFGLLTQVCDFGQWDIGGAKMRRSEEGKGQQF